MLSQDTTPQIISAASTLAQRVLDEGAQPILAAAQAAGLLGDSLPSLKTFLRAVRTGTLDAVKVGGRWLTSGAAVRRWVAGQQRLQERGVQAEGGGQA